MIEFVNTFIVVASMKNFSKAAKHLGISQPAVSRQIRLLEEGQGRKLFSRSPKHVELTREGRSFLSQVAPLLGKLQEALVPSGESQTFSPGEIRIGALSALGPFLDICLSFQKIYPACSLRLEYMGNDELWNAVKTNAIDFAVGTRPPDNEEIKVHRLGDSRSILIAGSGNRHLKGKIENLDYLPLVRYRFPGLFHQDPDSLVRPFLRKHQKQLGIKNVRFIFAVNSHYEMLVALQKLDAFAIIPSLVVKKQIEKKVLVQVSDVQIVKPVYVWHLDNPFMSYRLKVFKDFLTQEAKRLL